MGVIYRNYAIAFYHTNEDTQNNEDGSLYTPTNGNTQNNEDLILMIDYTLPNGDFEYTQCNK